MPGFIQNYREVVNSVERRQVLIAMTGGQLLVQLSSLPVTLALPSVARDFGYSVDEAAWIVIANLLVLGSTVFLGARLGDRFGHPRVFFIGTIIITVGAVGIVAAQDLTQVTILRGLQGFGAGLIHGNGNAMLAFAFPPGERGRAYAFPITGSRVGTFIGVAFFGVLLQWANWDSFAGWRLVFLTMLPIGLIVIKSCMPVVRRNDEAIVDKENPIDYLGAILLVAVSAAFILSGSHIHGGEESYTSPDALTYHLPMHGLTIALLVVFIFVERRVAHPFVEFQHFKQKYFTLAIISNVMFHLSMMATMILVPIMIEEGLDKSPIFVTYVLLPHQSFGIWLPAIAGFIHDKFNPRLLRTACMLSIASGFVLLALFAGSVSIWLLPLLLFPISVGTNIFNTVNNATVMSTLPTENRGFASGMLETTRDMGHATGATISSFIVAMIVPATIGLMLPAESQRLHLEGFQVSALTVVGIMTIGAIIAAFHRPYRPPATPPGGGARRAGAGAAAD